MLFIRNFHASDIPQVSEIVFEAFGRNYSPDFYLSISEGWEGGFLVAESESRVVGVLASVISAPKEARILLMAVRPLFRSRGIGTMLLSLLYKRCYLLDLKAINLEVRISNESGIRFYRRHGFLARTIISSYYEDGEAGYLMRKPL